MGKSKRWEATDLLETHAAPEPRATAYPPMQDDDSGYSASIDAGSAGPPTAVLPPPTGTRWHPPPPSIPGSQMRRG